MLEPQNALGVRYQDLVNLYRMWKFEAEAPLAAEKSFSEKVDFQWV